MSKREFTVANAYQYNRASPGHWIASHLLRYKPALLSYMLLSIATNALYSTIPILAGSAFNAVLPGGGGLRQVGSIALTLLAVIFITGGVDLGARICSQLLGSRVSRDARDELYVSLLEKSQTFHNRQRVGDIMARAANDIQQISDMIVPGFDIVYDSFVSLAVVMIYVCTLNPQLLLVPLLFTAVFLLTLRDFSRRLSPVSDQMREQFGTTNAVLNEAVTGVEVVKATAQEDQEKRKFIENAGRYRDFYVRSGRIQGLYLPTLLLSIALALAFLHGLYMLWHHQLTLGALVAYMGLLANLRYPAYNANWSFNLVQLGISGARRILDLMKQETTLDENEQGYHEEMRGDIVFEHVTFSYGGDPILKDISFHARPGQTIAIVGQTGAGKSSLTKLVNRIYDVDEGRVLIDGVDVRDWSLDALRSQISTIEQDIFLFSRSIAENIAYGLGQKANREAIEEAAKDAQAHGFSLWASRMATKRRLASAA